MSSRTILYAEDNENDVMLVKMAISKVAPETNLQTVVDGEEAVAYLKGHGRFSDRAEFPVPHLVLLDLKMPRMNGFEVIQWMRTDNVSRRLPIVVFTASLESKDWERCYQLGANSFLVKPTDIEELVNLLHTTTKYWLQWNRVAHPERPRFASAHA
jgi:CheY-like chemotaxis protein